MKALTLKSLSLAALLSVSSSVTAAVHLDPAFQPRLSGGAVLALGLSPDGTILAGGDFRTAGGGAAGGLARLAADGSSDPAFRNSGADAAIRAIAPGGVLGGGFSAVDEIAAPHLARLLASGEVDESFGIGTGPHGRVNCLAIDPAGGILAGGSFRTVNGAAAVYLARIGETGALDPGFASGLKPSFAMEAGVSALAVQGDGKILAGGNFETERGFEYLVRLNGNGSLDRSFGGDHGPMLYPKAILPLANGQVLVAGLAPDGKGFVRRLNADRSVDAAFAAPEFSGPVHALILFGGRVVAGGAFDEPAAGLARLNADGSSDPAWSLAIGGAVNVLALDGEGQLLAGGSFGGGVVRIVDANLNSYATNEHTFRAVLAGEPGRGYAIEVSGDLAHWTAFATATCTEGGVPVVEESATAGKRFFRARLIQ